MATVPRETTPLHSYDDAGATPGDPLSFLPTFSADDLAEVNHEPALDSLSSTPPPSGFQLHQPLAGHHSRLPPSPYGAVVPHFSPPPPPSSLPLYSYTEPSLSHQPQAPPPVTSADLRSLVSRSFQLPPQSNHTQHRAPGATGVPISSSMAIPTSVLTTPTEQQTTPTKWLPHSTGSTPTVGGATVSADSAERDSEQGTVVDDGSVNPLSLSEVDSPRRAERESSTPVEVEREETVPQPVAGEDGSFQLHYSGGFHLVDQSPLSPREIRDRLASLSSQRSTATQGQTAATLSTPATASGETLDDEEDGMRAETPTAQDDGQHNFEDVETSSVVSLEHITDALRLDPPHSLPLSDNHTTGSFTGNHAFSLPLSSSPLPLKTALPLHQKYSKSTKTPPPPPMRMPDHLRPSHKQTAASISLSPSSPHPPPHPPSSETRPSASLATHTLSSDQQLVEALHAKAHLEGQLATLSDECRELLRQRAELSSKLAVTEAELEVSRRQQRDSPSVVGPSEKKATGSAGLQGQLDQSQRELRQGRKALEAVREELGRVRNSEKQLRTELAEAREKEGVKAGQTREVNERLKETERELEEERMAREEAQQRLGAAQSSNQALEESKSWMQAQLQETLAERVRLQEELRATKSEAMSNSIKVEQLSKENSSFLEQITDLQRGILQDKARLVSELEAIEADVLSREDSYVRLVAERSQLEELARERLREIERLSSELGQSCTERDELRERETERGGRENSLAEQCRLLQRAKSETDKRLQETEAELASRDAEVKRLQRARASLQERVRESEAGLAGKEATLRGLTESQEVLQNELEVVRQANREIELELEEEKQQVAQLRASLTASTDDGRGEELVKSLQDTHRQLETENKVLRESVREKEAKLREKESELISSQKETANRAEGFQGKLDIVTKDCETLKHTVREREAAINQLQRESEASREELEKAKSERDHLETRLNTTLQQKSRLEGELLEQSSLTELEHLRTAVQESSDLRRELQSVKTAHQQEALRQQARQSQAERELRSARREAERALEQLQKAVQAREEATARILELTSERKRDAEKAKETLERLEREKEVVEREAGSLRAELEESQKSCQRLVRETEQMRQRLKQTSAVKAQLERESGTATARLQQTAEKRERELRDTNQALSLDVEQLRGRLAGVAVTQQAMRAHTAHLESSLAERNSLVTRLSAELATLEREKQSLEGQLQSETESMKEELAVLQTELGATGDQLARERDHCAQLVEELSRVSRELSQAKAEQTTDERSRSVLEEKVKKLSSGRDESRLELMSMRAELVVAKTATESAERELEDKTTQVEILQQKLLAAEQQCREREREAERVRALLDEQRETVAGGGRGVFDTSLSSIGGDEDTDSAAPATYDSSASVSSHGEPLHTAQLRQLGQQIERARREGQEAAQTQTSGEISVLRDQLGSKSRTINSLQSCLVSLKGDMGKLQSKIQTHSATVRASHNTTRQLESQLIDLKRSSSLQSPSFLLPAASSDHTPSHTH